jgi:4-hydroxy-3-methylbut-2-en-1-yl diphosphate synthase IspG/GcpE
MYNILRPEITWFFPLHLGSSEELLREFGGTTKGVRRHNFGISEELLKAFGGTISVSWRNYLRMDSDLCQEGDLLREVLDRSFTVPTVVQYCDFIPVMSTTHVIFECSSRSPRIYCTVP